MDHKRESDTGFQDDAVNSQVGVFSNPSAEIEFSKPNLYSPPGSPKEKEKRRVAKEEKIRRKAEEQEERRLAIEEEKMRISEEKERRRIAKEKERRRNLPQEQRRLLDEYSSDDYPDVY